MGALVYMLQVSACIAIFYSFYFVLLSRLTFFAINRYYLLGTLLISFIIPLLTIHLHQQDNYPKVIQQFVYVNTWQNFPAAATTTPLNKTAPRAGINWLQLLKLVYLLAIIAFFTRLVIAFVNFFARLRNGKIDRIGKVNILRGNKNLPTGSFLNYIFLSDDELSPDEMQQVIEHEMLHVKLLHSVDRIIARIVQIILWFNPFIYLYVRSIEENHEFEVDREIARCTDKNNYADLLLHLSIAKQGLLYHSFSKVPLKKRIIMLFHKPSASVKRVVYIFIIPVIIVSCLFFARLIKDDKKPQAAKHYNNSALYKRTILKKPDGKTDDEAAKRRQSGDATPGEVKGTKDLSVNNKADNKNALKKFLPGTEDSSSLPVKTVAPPNNASESKNAEPPVVFIKDENFPMPVYSQTNITEAFDRHLASITDKVQLFKTQNAMAWAMALRGENLEWAEKISKESLDIINELLAHPVTGPNSLTTESLNGFTYMFSDTYAYILYKEGEYNEALKIQEPLYERTIIKQGGPVATHYAEILIANNNYIKAREVAERGMRSKTISMGLEPVLKEIYIKINGNDNGYNEYLRNLIFPVKSTI